MHQKHVKMAKPHLKQWGRSEWAFIGTPCGRIQTYAVQLQALLAKDYKVAYVDADHAAADTAENRLFDLTYTDKINFQQIDYQGTISDFDRRSQFSQQDIILINGNHFTAQQQIVFLDPKKSDSLSRKLDRLTDIKAFVRVDTEGGDIIPSFLRQHCAHWADIPTFHIHDVSAMATFLAQNTSIPPLKGLVLAGGASQRMGQDKAQMVFHQQPQALELAELLASKGIAPHFSVRQEPIFEASGWPSLPDTFTGLGPLGAILSAFRHDPNAAWVVLACDLPLFNAQSLDQLLAARQAAQLATCFRSPTDVDGFPEPLVAIWEPKAYPVALQFLAQGYSCPRKILINTSILTIEAQDPKALTNVNTPEAAAYVRDLIAQK